MFLICFRNRNPFCALNIINISMMLSLLKISLFAKFYLFRINKHFTSVITTQINNISATSTTGFIWWQIFRIPYIRVLTDSKINSTYPQSILYSQYIEIVPLIAHIGVTFQFYPPEIPNRRYLFSTIQLYLNLVKLPFHQNFCKIHKEMISFKWIL